MLATILENLRCIQKQCRGKSEQATVVGGHPFVSVFLSTSSENILSPSLYYENNVTRHIRSARILISIFVASSFTNMAHDQDTTFKLFPSLICARAVHSSSLFLSFIISANWKDESLQTLCSGYVHESVQHRLGLIHCFFIIDMITDY